MALQIQCTKIKTHAATLILSGQINSDTAESLDREICRMINEGIQALVLDMKDVTFISSAGVGIIMKAKTSLSHINGELAIINFQPQVKKVFEIIQLLPSLNVFESVEELDQYLANIQKRIVEEGPFPNDDQ